MAEDKKSAVVYADWINTFEALDDTEAGRLIKHFFRYINDRSPEAPDRLTQIAFEPIKQQLKRDLVKYEEKKGKWSEAGQRSAEARRLKKQTSISVVTPQPTIVSNDSNPGFFNIGMKKYMYPVSKYVLDELQIHTNAFMASVKPITIEEVLKIMDVQYCGYNFNNHNHVLKSFDKIARDLKDGKKQYSNEPVTRVQIMPKRITE